MLRERERVSGFQPRDDYDPSRLGLPPLGTGPVPPFRPRYLLSPAELAEETSTLGWDTVFAIRLPDVNAALAKSGRYPKRFEQVVDEGSNYAARGDFGPWRLAQGGSGEIVILAVPITSGTMTAGEDSYPLDGATVYAAVKLKFLPQPAGEPARGDGATGQPSADGAAVEIDDLRVDTVSRSPQDPAVVIRGIDLTPAPTPFVYALMKQAMEEWFNANLDQFTYTFSTVSLNARAAEGQFQWLSPTYTGYAYSDDPTDEDECYFGVLCMLENADPADVRRHLSPGAIPAGQRAGFNISMKRFLEKLVLPGLPKAFTGSSVASFTLTGGDSVIQNTEPLRLPDVRVGAINYTPWVQRFELQVVGKEIQVHTTTKINVSPGIRAMVDCTSYQTIVVVDKPDGTQTLDFKQSREPYANHWVDKDPGITVTEILIGIIGAIAGGVVTEFLQVTSRIIAAAVIIAIVAGLAAATPELIVIVSGGGAAEALPPVTLLAKDATSPTKWPGGAEFKLTTAGLNGAFQLGGNPGFTREG